MLSNCGVGKDSFVLSPLDNMEIQPVHPKGDQSWVFIGRTDVEAETPIPWLPHAKSWLTGKDPDAGKDWKQKKRGPAEDEMVGLVGHALHKQNLRKVHCTLTTIFEKKCGGYSPSLEG